jgi:hypothetical protein
MIVAIVVGGMVTATAAALFVALGDQGTIVEESSTSVARVVNAERLVEFLVGNLDPGSDSLGLYGTSEEVNFRTWCEAGHGFLVSCRVRLRFRVDKGLVDLVLSTFDDSSPFEPNSEMTEIILFEGLRSGRVLYLVNPENGGTWSSRWSSLTIPPSIGLVLAGDTLILPTR